MEKKFGVRDINILNPSGTPTIESTGNLVFNTNGANERVRIKSTGQLRYVAAFTVAALPTAQVGDITRVTDANSPTVGATVSGGGAANALCWYNGSNWTVIGV